jgi:DNA-binding NtrC family response regulator
MRTLFVEIERFAPVDVPVLIRGESGTGKELVARAVQRLSRRRERPFETLNCADLTRELLRSELFGHERGAFTGAVGRSAGLVSRLDGGTLFMDEIGELAPDAQGMLLRFLQEGEGRRPVGAARSINVDVRVIAATHQDLEAGVERGTFREDFYYRLWWAVLEVPPLRMRREDIGLLVEHFRAAVNRRDGFGLDIRGVTREAMATLESDDWPDSGSSPPMRSKRSATSYSSTKSTSLSTARTCPRSPTGSEVGSKRKRGGEPRRRETTSRR